MAKSYTRMNLEERKIMQNLLQKGHSFSQIARLLERSPSTISREYRKFSTQKGYNYRESHKITVDNYKRNPLKIIRNDFLRRFIHEKLRLYWSPNQISNKLKEIFGMDKENNVSKETIYTYIYVFCKGELKKELISCLRFHKKSRLPRSRGKDRRGQIPDMISISERPKDVESRDKPGDWEGDLIMGKGNKSAIAVLVERTTRYTILVPLKNKDAHSVRKAMERVFKNIPSSLKKSLTYDRGKEMAEHKLFSKNSKIKVYFADPYSPWQRGTNENTNGLIRQFFPKGKDFNKVSRYKIKKVERLLNERPRQTLGFKEPYKVFAEKLAFFALES